MYFSINYSAEDPEEWPDRGGEATCRQFRKRSSRLASPKKLLQMCGR